MMAKHVSLGSPLETTPSDMDRNCFYHTALYHTAAAAARATLSYYRNILCTHWTKKTSPISHITQETNYIDPPKSDWLTYSCGIKACFWRGMTWEKNCYCSCTFFLSNELPTVHVSNTPIFLCTQKREWVMLMMVSRWIYVKVGCPKHDHSRWKIDSESSCYIISHMQVNVIFSSGWSKSINEQHNCMLITVQNSSVWLFATVLTCSMMKDWHEVGSIYFRCFI